MGVGTKTPTKKRGQYFPTVPDKVRECDDLAVLRETWRWTVTEKSRFNSLLANDKVKKADYRAWRLHYEEIKKHVHNTILRQLGQTTFNEFRMVLESLHIRDKNFKVIPFRLNSSQIKIAKAIHKMAVDGKPIRIVLLKARQFGGSTLVEALQYLMSRAIEGTQFRVVSNDAGGARHLYGMFSLFWAEDKLQRELRYTKTGLEYKDCGGRVHVDSGYKSELGRGFTLYGLHLSEIAFWRDAERSCLSLMQTVPDKPGTMIIFESTANGVGDFFYDLWHRSGDDFVRVFVGWWEHEEYRTPFKDKKAREDFALSLTPAEQKIGKAYDLSMEQLHWRRQTIANKCNGDIDQFKQEYPANADEAFLHSGRNVFAGSILDYVKRRVMRYESLGRVWRGELTINRSLERPDEFDHRFMSTNGGRLTVFEKPVEDHFYAIGVDVAEGIEVDNPTKHGSARDSDNSAITVVDYGGYTVKPGTIPHKLGWKRGEEAPAHEVLSWYGKCEPDELAYLLFVIANRYNKANVGIERNNHGLTTIDHFTKILKYPSAYCIKSFDFDNPKGNRRNAKIGWTTTKVTRPIMFDKLVSEVRDDNIWMLSDEFVKEGSTFIIDKNGKMISQLGYKDDKLVSAALALQVMNRMPKRKSVQDRLEDGDKQWKEAHDKWAKGKPHGGWTPVTFGKQKRRRR
ncbi:MAG: hypothetical protein GY833_16410 [Aestuariibacter sp.]|nr:hypothetical protein [Aestuariibacter sp.]